MAAAALDRRPQIRAGGHTLLYLPAHTLWPAPLLTGVHNRPPEVTPTNMPLFLAEYGGANVYVIRPDGYVGYRAAEADAGRLRAGGCPDLNGASTQVLSRNGAPSSQNHVVFSIP